MRLLVQLVIKNRLHKINLTIYFVLIFLNYTVLKIYRAYCSFVSYDNVQYASKYYRHLRRISSLNVCVSFAT
jgi:cytochrome c oxidase assembly protein Cox11